MKQKIKALFQKLLSAATEEEKTAIKAEITELEGDLDKLDAGGDKKTDGGSDSKYDAVLQQLSEMKEILGKSETSRINAEKALEEERKTKRGESITKLVEDGIKDGKIVAEKKDLWIKRFEKDFDLTKEMLEEAPKNPNINRDAGGGDKGDSGGDKKTETTVTVAPIKADLDGAKEELKALLSK